MRNNILQVIWKKVQEPKMVRFLLTALLIVLITLAYHKPLMELYEDYIITPLLKPFESNIGVALITYFLLLACSWDIVKRWKIRYQFSKYWIGGLCFAATLLLVCRQWSNYEYVFWIGSCAYVDVIALVCFAYVDLALFNCYKKEKAAKDGPIGTLLEDKPIESGEEDVFKLKGEAEKIAKEIRVRNRAKTCSIAITAPWGGGKSSFLNLIRKQIDESEFEIVYFVPRDSKSVQTIQEDFFSMIACVLAKYDSRCSHIIKDYMASLQLIDNRSIVERVLSLYRIWDKDSLKDSIKESFAALKKRVLVIIDDFDRLSKEEILEVLKLIDGNAAFTNLIFLTAYDKEQVNRILGETYKTSDACFVDKFFDVEFAIPFRPYIYIAKYIEETLCKQLGTSDGEEGSIQQVITEHTSIFKEYIPTLRDAKRYINQVLLDFKQIWGEVIVRDFLLLQLVKYRYPELYKGIFKLKYLEIGGKHPLFGNDIFYLKTDKNLEKDNGKEVSRILPVLKLLFTQVVDNSKERANYETGDSDDDNDKNTYRCICERTSFYNYFGNQIYSALRISEMQVLFEMEWTEAKMKINEWAISKEKFEDFVNYLDYCRMGGGFDNTSLILRYIKLVTYTADKLPNSQAYELFVKLMALQDVKGLMRKNKLNENDYKSALLEIMKADDSKLYLVRALHDGYRLGKLKEETYLIKHADVWPFMKDKFIEAAGVSTTNEQWLKMLLYECIEPETDSSGEVVFNQACLRAYRKRIEKAPAFYISDFIVPRWFKGSDYYCFTCEHCCREIFGDKTQLEAFLKKCKEDELAGSLVALNCWQLYKANNFMPIDYRNIGPVNEMIKNDLVEEIEMLDKMKQKEKVISEINVERQTLTSEELTKLSEQLSKNKKEIKSIQLPIALKDEILNVIDHKLKILSQIQEAQES